MIEEWKSIIGADGYFVSNMGNVKSVDRWIKKGRGENPRWRKGVLLKCGRDMDGDKQNNKLSNLEYLTHSENHIHCRKVLKKLVGKNHWNYKHGLTCG